RDNLFVPTAGGVAEASVEYAAAPIGSQLEFVRGRVTLEIFHQLRRGLVVGAAWRTGLIAPIRGDDSIPLQERFFNGGENSVRAFHQDELGPLDDSRQPIGGESFSTLSVELRQHLFDGLQGAIFVDSGNVGLDASDYKPFSDLRTGYGVGLRYLLPVGPLRLDGAWKTDRQPGEDAFVLHFSVGMAF
ncbi:MAG: BamA/TamA family outer membrane protein, partial [Acidobacteria bacterium]|nr:BamA/TamA family outer membrane protein [Acidobacteriota bacterium]